MRSILTALILCIAPLTARADTELLPRAFDLHDPFFACVAQDPDKPYRACQDVLYASYTLRREIGYALQTCNYSNVQGCVDAVNAAGFPAKRLGISTLGRCEIINLDETEAKHVGEATCIETLARQIEAQNISTTHDTSISCGINYIECAEIIDKGEKYWQEIMDALFAEKLQAIAESDNLDTQSNYRYYSLFSRQHQQKIELAKTTCSLLVVVPHWGNIMDYQSCMGQAYADIWGQLNRME